MGRAQHLTYEEKIKIEAYHDAGLSSRQIGQKIFRSHTVVVRFLKNATSGGRTDNRGRKSKLTERDKRRIFREAVNHNRSSAQIRAELQLPVTTRRVRQIMAGNKHLEWRKRLSKPKFDRAPQAEPFQFRYRVHFLDQRMEKCYIFG